MGLRQSLRVATGALLLACGLQFAHANSDPHTIVFGVAPGPYGDMVKQAIAPTLKEKGYKVVVREFSDYVQPNMALSNGSIDANLFQHSLYFDKFTADKGLKLSKLIVVPTAGMGFYSHKIKSLDELKKGDVITLSNDPTNLARGLRFLQSIGLITIKDTIDPTKASERDIASNPKGLVFKPLEAAQDADVVITDVWASMGQEGEAEKRKKAFHGYQINDEVMAQAHDDAMVLHCLPAHREEEITTKVFEAHANEIFEEAENRLHAQKAVMVKLMA